jgi:putative glutamine amidotransferase
MRPLIGIPCHIGLRAETERPIYYNNRSYIHAVESAGGMPILLPFLHDLNELSTLHPHLDGLLISGGVDVDAQWYDEEPCPLLGSTMPHLDEMELRLARWAYHNHVPTLGICRGMQLMNVMLGGSLYQDLATQYPNSLRHANWDLPRNTLIHAVKIKPGSQMEEILGVSEVMVNSLHHQGLHVLGDGVVVSGEASDGVAELLEVPGHPFFLAAQCHPEELYETQPVWLRLFEAFVAACQKTEKDVAVCGTR